MDTISFMDFLSFKCHLCDRSFDSLNSLVKHSSRVHKVSSQETYTRVVLNGRTPSCECGCGEIPKYWDTSRGFSKFRPGHQARVHNNWGHNERAHENSRKTQLEMHANGELSPWNKGLSGEIDSRVARITEKGQLTILNNLEERQRRSDWLKESRLNGRVKTLYGKDHSQWKGGVSALQPLCRARLHSRWVYPKLKAGNFTCQECGAQKDLCVHHDNERFAQVLQKAIEALGEPGDDPTKCSETAEWVVQYHVQNDVSGVVLCEDCHNEAHRRIDDVVMLPHT